MCKTKQQNETARGNGDWQGMNWIRQDKRLAIYLNHDVTANEIEDHVATAKKTLKPHRIEAKELIARRGSAARVLASL